MTVPPSVPPGPPGPPPPPPPSDSQPEPGHRRPRLIGAAVALGVLVVASLAGLLSGMGGLSLPILLIPVALVLGTVAMISPQARPYATGFLMTMGVMLVVLGGLCVVLLSGLSSTGY